MSGIGTQAGFLQNGLVGILKNLSEASSLPSGRYEFDFGDGVVAGTVSDEEGGGWLLFFQYVHSGGTNPPLTAINRGDDLPELSATALGGDDSADASLWGHAGFEYLASIPDAAEFRWYGATTNHSRIIHFRSTQGVSAASQGSGTFPYITLASNFTALTGHTGILPAGINNGNLGNGNQELSNFPYFQGQTAHWSVQGSGSRWEVDDYLPGASSTIHRIWVRA